MAPRPDFRAALDVGLMNLSFPISLRPALEECLKHTRFVHLGYAEKGGRPVGKLYCEAAPAPGARAKMHVGFKWRLGDPDEFAVDEYWRLGDLDEKALRTQIAETMQSDKALSRAVEIVLDRILAHVPASELFFLEVLRGGARRSMDLRLYDAPLVLDNIRDVAQAAAGLLDAGPVDEIFTEHGSERLGHVSAGPGFITFYHGAEDL